MIASFLHRALAGVVAALFVCAPAGAADWPRFMGPAGDGRSPETGILTDWQGGLETVWQLPLGEGYGGPSVADGNLFIFDRVGDDARLTRADAATGKVRWRATYPTAYVDSYQFGNGPRTTPLIDGDRVYTFGVEGRLQCRRVADGELLWEVDTAARYGVVANFFGVGSTPVVEGDLLIVMVGGSPPGSPDIHSGKVRGNGSAIVAFDRLTGEERYRFGDELASYASLQVATIGGKRRGLAFTRGGLLVFEPVKGKELSFHPWRARKLLSVNAASPLVVGDRVLVSEGYGPGSVLIEIDAAGKGSVVWKDRRREEALLSHWATPVHHAGIVYGCSGAGAGDAELRAVELATGKVRWSEGGLGRTTMIHVDGHLVVLAEGGELLLVRADPESYTEVARWQPVDGDRPLLKPPAWHPPVLADGLLYARGKDRLAAFRLIPKSEP